MGAASAGIGAASHNIEAAAGNSINSFQLLIPPTTMKHPGLIMINLTNCLDL